MVEGQKIEEKELEVTQNADTQESNPVEVKEAPVAQGAISSDDVDDIINPIIPRIPVDGKGIPVVLVSKPEIGYTKNGKAVLTIVLLEQAADATAKINVFLPTELADQKTEAEQKMAKGNFGKIKHIIGALIPDGIKTVTGNTYYEVIEQMIAQIPDSVVNNNKINLSVKLVYDLKTGWLGFPNFPTFISSNYKKANFEWNPQYDSIVKPEKAKAGSASTAEVDMEKYTEV